MKHSKHNTKNNRLIKAGRVGKMVNLWGLIAEVADRVCDYALSKQDTYAQRQKRLIGDIMAEEMLGTTVA